ncbi:hypothetical protein B0H19DRAFT_651555 [Mycena capillaripes]|nr:hypothetical protein B0H19DRAFT_651555 [Mycena capillaripes]
MPALDKPPIGRKHQVTETYLESLKVDRIITQPSSPIHSLPTELLADILILALTPGSDEWGHLISTSFKNVLLFCRICGHWRQVALNTPQLWAEITFPLSVPKQQSFAMNKMFLERSSPFPISVYFHHLAPDLVPLLASASYRSRVLTINSGSKQFEMAILARLLAGNLKNLEKLRLRLDNVDSETQFFLSAPRLHDLILEVPRVSTNILSISWTQLTRLQLECEPQLCLDILVRCENLISARVVTDQWPESDSPDFSVLEGTGLLPHLEDLNIFMRIRSTSEHLGPFLQKLRLPMLKSLSLTLTLGPGDQEWFTSWLVPEMIFFLTRSPNLQNLEVFECFLAEDMHDILLYTPSLTSLIFTEIEVDDDFFAALQYSETNAAQLAPKLETLDLIDVGVDFTETSIADMIQSRWWSDDELLAMPTPPSVARLKRVNFYNHHLRPKAFTEEFKEKMEEYRSQGLELEGFWGFWG